MSCNCCPQPLIEPRCGVTFNCIRSNKACSTNFTNSSWAINLGMAGELNGTYVLSTYNYNSPIVTPIGSVANRVKGIIVGQNVFDTTFYDSPHIINPNGTFPQVYPAVIGLTQNNAETQGEIVWLFNGLPQNSSFAIVCNNMRFDIGVRKIANNTGLNSIVQYDFFLCLFKNGFEQLNVWNDDFSLGGGCASCGCYNMLLTIGCHVDTVRIVNNGPGGIGAASYVGMNFAAHYATYLPTCDVPDRVVLYKSNDRPIFRWQGTGGTNIRDSLCQMRALDDFESLPDTIVVERV